MIPKNVKHLENELIANIADNVIVAKFEQFAGYGHCVGRAFQVWSAKTAKRKYSDLTLKEAHKYMKENFDRSKSSFFA